MHVSKKVISVVAAAMVMAVMPVAMPELNMGVTVSAEESSAISSSTFTGTVDRIAGKAMSVTNVSDSALGDKVYVSASNATDFVVGDVVEITYSGAVTEDKGVKTITADSVKKVEVSTPETEVVPIIDDVIESEPEPEPSPAPVVDNTVTTTDKTPSTGDMGIEFMATVGVLAGAVITIHKSRNK